MDPEHSDTDALLRRLDADFARSMAVIYVYLTAVMTSGVLGNLLVIVVYVTKFKATTTRTFIVTLAVLDLIGCVQGIPLEFVILSRNFTFPSPALCKWYATVNAFCALTSVLVLLVVAGDRYRRICRPLLVQLTRHNARQASLCCSAAAILLAWPFPVLWGNHTQHTGIANVTGTKCYVDNGFLDSPLPLVYSTVLFALFAGSVVVLVTLYALIYGQIRRQLRLHGCAVGPQIRVSLAAVVPSIGGPISGEATNEANKISPADSPDQAAAADSLHTASISQEATSSGSEEAPVSGSSGDAVGIAQDAPCRKHHRPRTSSLSNLKCFLFGESGSMDIAACEDDEQDVKVSAPRDSSSTRKLTSQISELRSTDDDSELTDATFVGTATDIGSNIQQVSSNEAQNPSSGHAVRPRTARFGTLELPGLGGLMRKMKKRAEAVRKTTLTLFLVTLIYVLSFLPYLVVTTLSVVQSDLVRVRQGSSAVVYELLVRSFYLQNAANPFIYGFRNQVFRAKCRQLMSRRRR